MNARRFPALLLALAALVLAPRAAPAQNPAPVAPVAEAPPAALPDRVAALEAAQKAGPTTDAVDAAGNKGDAAWMLVSTAFVMLMLPGLALFYGGMVRRKNILATMMQSMACLAVVGLYWAAFGYALAFGPSVLSLPKTSLLGFELEGGIWGFSWDLVFLSGIAPGKMLPAGTIPVTLHMLFQGMFAIITPALISGAVAERIRFWPFCIFTILWVTFVYCPLAHMVWAFDWFYPAPVADGKKLGETAVGILGKLGALDFAGGTVVHIAAGFAGLMACLVLRRRDGYPKQVIHPNSMVITLLGAGLLWFGWFGFNGGSALNSSSLSVSAFAATQVAAAAAGLGWLVVEWLHKGKATALGLASGVVAGLVAVTPASGYVPIYGGAAIGFLASVICYGAVWLKSRLGYDDSLDAFGIHGVGGLFGALLTGVFCSAAVNPAGADGYFALKALPARVQTLEKTLIPKATGAKQAELVKDYEAELASAKARLEAAAKDGKTPWTQFKIQGVAVLMSVAFACVLSLGLVLLTQAITLNNFTTDREDETIGLDRTEHGEAGFDFGYAGETAALAGLEPRAASAPKAMTGRFDLAVEGVAADDIAQLWTGLCRPGEKAPHPDFLAVYPHVTTFSGNRFHCRGADAPATAARLESLFKKLLPGRAVRVVRL